MPGLFEYGLFENRKGEQLPYRLLKPELYNPNEKYPLVIFLHGSGEKGNDNEQQLKHGGDLFLKAENRTHFPAFVVFPQCPLSSSWVNFSSDGKPILGEHATIPLQLVFELLIELNSNFSIDDNRIYLIGISQGGAGTFEAITRSPGIFAAAAPICGWGDTSKADSIKNIPIWIFHGAQDPIVSVEYSRMMEEALKNINPFLIYTEYPEAGHDCWDEVFKNDDLIPWMFSQKRLRVQQGII